MTRIKPVTAGIALGAFAIICHAAWSALVAAGLAQGLLDLIFGLHFITPPFHVEAFDLGAATLLLVTNGVVGFVAGALLASIWNSLARRA
jgi:hypothetical protein